MRIYRTAIALAIATLIGISTAQSVGALQQGSWDLPRTPEEAFVLSQTFEPVDAVQTQCPQDLLASLAAEGALAACATPRSTSYLSSYGLGLVGRRLDIYGTWLTPWQENASFGSVRRYSYKGVEYYVAINTRTGLLYVIRFTR